MSKKIGTFRALTRRDFLQMLGATTTAAALTACGTPGSSQQPGSTTSLAQTTGDPQRGGTLRMALPDTPTFADPTLPLSTADMYIWQYTCEGLTWVDTNLAPQPRLATAWEMADDGLSWTFTLREGVTFHHGSPCTATDVVYTYERILGPATASTFRETLGFVDRIEAVDASTVRFHLSRPNTELPWLTSSPVTVILPHDRTIEQLIEAPLGTGPFRFREYRSGEQSIFVRNETYWDTNLPYLDELRMVYMPEPATQVAALLSGTIDAIAYLDFESIAALAQSDAVQVIEHPGGNYEVMVMRATEKPFDDVRVRQALKHCVDRQGMLQAVILGHGTMGNDQPISPVDPVWADIPPLAYDIEQAKQLLAEAGYPDGLNLTLHASQAVPGSVAMAVAFQEMAKPAGITIQIERVPAETYWTNYYMQVPFFISTGVMTISTSAVLTTRYQSDAPSNEGAYQNPELDALIEAAASTLDTTKRIDSYAQIQRIISEEGTDIIPYFKPTLVATRTSVQQFEPTHRSFPDLRETWLAQRP